MKIQNEEAIWGLVDAKKLEERKKRFGETLGKPLTEFESKKKARKEKYGT